MPPFENLTEEQAARLRNAGFSEDEIRVVDRARARQAAAVRPTGMALPDVAPAEELEAQQERREGPPGILTNVLAPLVNAALLNQVPDLLEAAGQPGRAERFQGAVEQAQEEQPTQTGLLTLLGLGAPGAGSTRLLSAGARRARGVVGPAVERLFAGPAPRTALVARGAAEAATEGAVGAVGGAAEGALLGRGAAFGESPEARREAATTGGIAGGLLGGAAFGTVGTGRALASPFRLTDEIGRAQRIQRSLARRSGLPSRAATRKARRDLRREKRATFRNIEESTPTLPDEVSELIQDDPALRRVLNRVAADSEEGQAIVRNLNAIDAATQAAARPRLLSQQGVPIQQLIRPTEIPERASIPFKLAQNIEQEVARLKNAHARGDTNISGLAVEEAEAAFARLRDTLNRTVPGYDRAIALTAREKAAENAFLQGERASAASVDPSDARAFLAGESTELRTGKNVRALRKAPGTEEVLGEEAELFRAGMAAKLIDRLREGRSAAEIRKALNAPAQQERLRIILGSDEAAQGFLQEMRREQAAINVAKMVENVVKFGGFILLGSSLAGNTILSGLE